MRVYPFYYDFASNEYCQLFSGANLIRYKIVFYEFVLL